MTRVPRTKLRLADWPAEDRVAWNAAFAPGDLLEDGGPASHLSERSRANLRYQFECFLGFLSEQHPEALTRPAAERPSRTIISQYAKQRLRSGTTASVAAELHMFRLALRVICPAQDWSWLLQIGKRLAAQASNSPKRLHSVTSEQLYALGIALMDEVVEVASDMAKPSKAQGFAYRDGLIIALLGLVPPRRRTLAALRIGQHLVQVGTEWTLDIPAEDTKNHRALDFPLSPEMSQRINVYLSQFRPRIPGSNKHDYLWASNKGRGMAAGAIYDMVRSRTKKAFGFPVNLHRFRHAAATLWSIHDPGNVRGVKDLLGHASFGTTEKHYIMGQSRLAGRALARVVDLQKERSR